MNEEDPDVYIVCIECGFKEPIGNVKDPHHFLCNRCLLESKMELKDKVDLSIESNDLTTNPHVDLNILDF